MSELSTAGENVLGSCCPTIKALVLHRIACLPRSFFSGILGRLEGLATT